MVGKGTDLLTRNPRIRVSTRPAGSNIEIEVADNGPGIAAENLQKILEPLFTTKSFGVGLGLPAVEKILEQHGGGLRIESRPGEGAAFTAWFPIEQPARQAA
jgi:signal transduction histidine kinase